MAASATLSFKSKPSETYSLDTNTKRNNQLRDPSFSSYLNSSEQNLVHKLVQSTRPPNNLSFSFKPQDLLDLHRYLGHKELDDHGDQEIGVFGAEKYFSGAMDHGNHCPSPIAKPVLNTPPTMKEEENEPKKPTLVHATAPSIVSESSMNSHSAFLRRPDPPRKKSNKVCFQLLSSLIIGSCKCSCADVYPPASTPTKTGTTEISESPRTLPETMEKFRNFTGAVRDQSPTEPPKKSLEVFGSPSKTREEDMDSDASSDLFEIESLTGKVDSYLTRQTSGDTTSDCPTTARYAPSEASIEWSVVTASAADFSLMSDCEDRTNDMKLQRPKVIKNGGGAENNSVDRRPRQSGGGNFLGCKSQKAVEVSGDALKSVSRRFRTPEERIIDSRDQHGSSSGLAFSDAVARFQAETRLSGFGLKNLD